jgi:hypothetical protein
MEVVESMVLVRLLPGVPRTMIDDDSELLGWGSELLRIEGLPVRLAGDFGKTIGCAQSGIFISTFLSLQPPVSIEAKERFRSALRQLCNCWRVQGPERIGWCCRTEIYRCAWANQVLRVAHAAG